MRQNAIIRIILLSVLLLFLTGILLSGIGINSYVVNIGHSSGTVADGQVELSPDEIRNLEIDWAAGSVTIGLTDANQIIFYEEAEEDCTYKMLFESAGDTLTIHYGKENLSFSFGNHSYPRKDLTILVPKDWVCEELDVDGAALELNITGVEICDLDLDGAAMNVVLDGSIHKLACDGAGCSLNIRSKISPSSISLDGAGCDLKLMLPENTGFVVEINGLGCDFSSPIPYSSAQNTHCFGDQSCKIEANGLGCGISVEWITEK